MCEIDIGNPKYMTFTKLVQVRNFITFELKVIRHEERERHNLSMLTACTSAPNHVWHPICKLLVWPWRASKVNLLLPRQELNSLLFLKSPKSSAHASGAWCHSPPPVYFYLGFYFDICEWRILRALRENLRLCLHLTNPSTVPKGPHPN